MPDTPQCPQCSMTDALLGADGYECQVCGFEWQAEAGSGIGEVLDANGGVLSNGDSVVVIKELKLNGKSGGVKMGTKVKAIRLVEGDHPISGKVDGRSILIKAEFVKRAK
ncbi:UNVERIFIED_CONTAM: hypothetical protein GTU68_000717 [Idotea baltica]|nr:hypothetical protein [Idotea baltica]